MFEYIKTYAPALFNAFIITSQLSIFSIALGSLIGLLIGGLRTGKHLSGLLRIGTEIIESIPVLIFIIWMYFALPILTGIQISGFLASTFALSANLGAFSSEIFRSGIQTIPKHQIEAAKILGYNFFQILRYIIFPQALIAILPSLFGRYIETVKLTSLATFVAVDELLHVTQNIVSVSYEPLTAYTVLAILYAIIIFGLITILRIIEKYIHASN